MWQSSHPQLIPNGIPRLGPQAARLPVLGSALPLTAGAGGVSQCACAPSTLSDVITATATPLGKGSVTLGPWLFHLKPLPIL